MVSITTVASGLGGAIGCDYDSVNDRLVFVEYSGKVSAIDKVSTAPVYHVLGTGYTTPEDIALSADGIHAYVTERTGTLLRISLSSAGRAAAIVVTSGMTAPQQFALDEAHGYAYVVEFASPGKLWRVNLVSGVKTPLISSLSNAIGVLLTSDFSLLYISDQAGGRISQVDLATLHSRVLVSGLVNPFFLTWADENETGILTTERDPANRLTLIDLSQSPVATRQLLTGVPSRPSSVAVAAPDTYFICSNDVVSKAVMTPYVSSGPTILGIGFVPFDRIVSGYADTTVDPSYFYQVKDSPFGGTLPIMINHTGAYASGARYYKLDVDGVEPLQSYSDYEWNTLAGKFELVTVSPSSGFYRLHQPGEIWYNNWLGYMLDTSGMTNSSHTITVKLYKTKASPMLSSASLAVQIDNTWPSASIDQIIHDGIPVDTCAIVTAGSHFFTFKITATSPQQHLLNWSLVALWGDNKSKGVGSDGYGSHVTPSKLWTGYVGTVPVPPAPAWDAFVLGDPTSIHCAHTFRLSVWDRVIDGWNYLHYSEYDKSITIMVP